MKIDDKQFRPLLIKVLNKLLPYTQDGWKYQTDDLPYKYEWGDEDKWGEISSQIQREIAIVEELSASGVIVIEKKADPTVVLPDIRKHLSNEPPVMVMGENGRFIPYWHIYIHSIDKIRLAELIDGLGLEQTAFEIIERPALAQQLGGKIEQITRDFWIHDGKLVSIRGRRIMQKPQNDRIAVMILTNYKSGAMTPLDAIDKDHARANRIINEVRTAFKSATGQDYDHFHSEHKRGYRFKP